MSKFFSMPEPARTYVTPADAERAHAADRETKRTRRAAQRPAPDESDRSAAALAAFFPRGELAWGKARKAEIKRRERVRQIFIQPEEAKILRRLDFDVDQIARSCAHQAARDVAGLAVAAEDDKAERAVKREVARRRRRAKERKEAKRSKERRARAKRREEHRKAKRREERRTRPGPDLADRPHRAHGQAKHRALAQIDAQIDAYLGGQHRRLMA